MATADNTTGSGDDDGSDRDLAELGGLPGLGKRKTHVALVVGKSYGRRGIGHSRSIFMPSRAAMTSGNSSEASRRKGSSLS